MADTEPETTSRPSLNPVALSVRDAARLLTKAGKFSATESMVSADLDAGAPKNPDGTLNLIHYAAWLAQRFIGKLGDSDVD